MLGPFVRSGERIVSAEQLMLGGARVAAGLDSLGVGAEDGAAIYHAAPNTHAIFSRCGSWCTRRRRARRRPSGR